MPTEQLAHVNNNMESIISKKKGVFDMDNGLFPKNYSLPRPFYNRLFLLLLCFACISPDISLSLAFGSSFKISASPHHILFIDKDGTLWTWGKNDFGQLGDGTRKDRLKPVAVLKNVKEVAAGLYHSLALKEDGTLLAWGKNDHGQIGNGSRATTAMPVIVMDDVMMISAGSYHSMAVTKNGTLWVWGSNNYGQIGDGKHKDRLKPVNILAHIADICAGSYQSFAIDARGNLFGWGRNRDGRLGDGTTTDRNIPVKILSNVVKVSAGNSHTLALRSNRRLFAWGSNLYGQIGDRTHQPKKRPVPILRNVIDIGTGAYHSMALMKNGKLWAWGANSFGQLGDGTTADKKSPVRVKIPEPVSGFMSGPFYGIALDRSNSLWGWGRNNLAQLRSSGKAFYQLPLKIEQTDRPEPASKLTRIISILFQKTSTRPCEIIKKERVEQVEKIDNSAKTAQAGTTSIEEKIILPEKRDQSIQTNATVTSGVFPNLKVRLESHLTTRINMPVAAKIEINDVENSLARVVVLKQPLHGSVRVDAHQLLYKPENGYQGKDQIVLVFIGKQGQTLQKRVEISILPGTFGEDTLGLQREFSTVPLAELSHFIKAQQLAEAGKPFMAIEEYKKAIASDDNRLQAYWNLSMVQYQLGFVDDAIKTLEKAVDTGAPADFLYLDLGIFYFGKGLMDKAKNILFQALELNPGLTDAYYYLGMLFRKKGDCQMAWLFAKTAKKLGHKGRDLHEGLAEECQEPQIEPWQAYEDPEYVYMRQINVDSLDRAKAVLDKIREGELFEVIAGRESVGPYTMVGGYAGRFKLSELEANLAEALKAQPIFGFPQLVKTTNGFLIVQRIAPFDFAEWQKLLNANKATPANNHYEE